MATRSIAVSIHKPEASTWLQVVLMKRAVVSQDTSTVRGCRRLAFLSSLHPTGSNFASCAFSPCRTRCSFPAISSTAVYHAAIMRVPFYVAPLRCFNRTACALSPRLSSRPLNRVFLHIDTRTHFVSAASRQRSPLRRRRPLRFPTHPLKRVNILLCEAASRQNLHVLVRLRPVPGMVEPRRKPRFLDAPN